MYLNVCKTEAAGQLPAASMDSGDLQSVFQATLTDRDFWRLARAIESLCGIKMPLAKKLLLEGRLRKRLRQLGMRSFEEYCERLFEKDCPEEEFDCVVDLVTTNKTEFFREPRHFEHLEWSVLPQFFDGQPTGCGETFLVWSAGCSSGEEPYTIAMVLSDYAEKNPGFQFVIKATDICTQVMEKGRLGIYRRESADSIPMPFRKKYLLKHRDKNNPVVRIAPEIRKLIEFRHHNLLDDISDFPSRFHLIYCRNVIIYFDRATQKRVLENLCRRLVSGGHLFLGHSETLNGLDLPLINVATTIYRKKG